MTPDQQIAQIATLAANVKSLIDAVADLRAEMRQWRSEFVSEAQHKASMEAMEKRVSLLEQRVDKNTVFAWIGKWGDVARFVIALAAVGALIVAAVRGWPGA